MIPIPTPVTDRRNLADWLEFRALAADDQSASLGDLRRAVMAIGGDSAIATSRLDAVESQDENLATDAFSECLERSIACGEGYPFEIDGSLLKVKTDITKSWAYVFCLILSLKGANRGEAEDSPTNLFEEIAEIAARVYVSGKSVKFGFPRRVMASGFHAAVDQMCKEIGEGRGCKKPSSSQKAKDARLDIVAWRPFPDKRPSQMMLFGQCAAGGNWTEKLSDLQPRDSTDLYWVDPPYVLPMKGFFTPFRLALEGWDSHSKYGGILFERCRISHLAYGHEAPPGVIKWSEETVKGLAS